MMIFQPTYFSFGGTDQTQNDNNYEKSLYDLSLDELSNVTITTAASLFKQRQLDVTATVSTIKESDWKDLGARQTFDPLQYLPGIKVYQSFGGHRSISIRGFPTRTGTMRGVNTLLDGIPLNDLASGSSFFVNGQIDLGLLQDMEVVRGPASSIYGTDAFFGVLSMKSWSSDKDAVNGQIEYGSFKFARATIRASKSVLIPDLRFTVLAGFSSQNGVGIDYSQTTTNGGATIPLNWTEQRAFYNRSAAVKLNYKGDTELGLYYINLDANSWPGASPLFPRTSDPYLAGKHNTSYLSKLSHTFHLPVSINLETQAYYWKDDVNNLAYLIPLQTNLISSSYDADRKGLSLYFKRLRDDVIPTQLLFGYTFDAHTILDAFSQSTTGMITRDDYSGASRNINGLILQTDTALFNKTTNVIAGARYDSYSDGYNRFQPQLGLIYHIDPDSAVKFLYGTAFRAPVAVELYGNIRQPGNPSLRPETIETEELSYMNQGSKHVFTVGIFNSLWSNGISQPMPALAFANISTSRGYGLESEFKYQPGPLGGFVNGTYVRSADISNGGDTEYLAFPKYMTNFGLTYKCRSPSLTFNLNNRFEWIRNSGAASSVPLPPYLRTDFGVDWDVGSLFGEKVARYELGFNIKNIFNRTNYQPSTFNLPGGFQEAGISAIVAGRIAL